jgi:glutamate carboxypeptidase
MVLFCLRPAHLFSCLSLVLLFASCSPLQAQKLTAAEQKVARYIEQQSEEALGLLEKVVNINSGTGNHEGVRQVGDLFRRELDGLGFATRWIDMPDSVNRAGHLFAERQGKKGKRVLLIGHLDTVFEKDSPFQRFERTDSVLKGPGVNDMKGGDVVILYALKALHSAGLLSNTQIIVAFTGDEESAGKPLSISRKDLVDAAKRSEAALAFETATGFGQATVARRGSSNWRLEVTGNQAHSAGVFSERVGDGAIYEAARILNAFHDGLKGEKYLTFNPGLILGGTEIMHDATAGTGQVSGKGNIVAQTAVVTGDLRFISEEQKERTREKMRQIVARSLPGTSAKIIFQDSYPAMPPTPGNEALLAMLNRVSLDLGHGPVQPYDPGARGAGDVSFVAPYVSGLDGLGTMGSGAHSPNETMNPKTFQALTQRAALLIYRLTNK